MKVKYSSVLIASLLAGASLAGSASAAGLNSPAHDAALTTLKTLTPGHEVNLNVNRWSPSRLDEALHQSNRSYKVACIAFCYDQKQQQVQKQGQKAAGAINYVGPELASSNAKAVGFDA